MKLNLKRPLAVFDIESTGISAATDRIVEIAILKVLPDGTEEMTVQRINPGIPIPVESSKIHGIYDKDVKDCPTFAEKGPELLELIKDCDFAGFNSNRFDIPILVEEFLRAGIMFDPKDRNLIDAYRIFTMMEKRDLTSAYKFYCGKDLVNAHTADADVWATYEVLKAQIERYEEVPNDMSALNGIGTDDTFVDYGRRIVLNEKKVPCFNFGKHKGKPVVDVFNAEPSYYDWMMRSDFMLHTKQKLKEIKMQMKFGSIA